MVFNLKMKFKVVVVGFEFAAKIHKKIRKLMIPFSLKKRKNFTSPKKSRVVQFR